MGLEEQLSELLAQLGVVLDEDDEDGESDGNGMPQHHRSRGIPQSPGPTREGSDTYSERGESQEQANLKSSMETVAELSLFQTSREHYGVFYRLDLTAGVPQLRVFMPEDEGALKMRCYFVRAAIGSPLHEWFATDRRHAGSEAYNDARESAQQHLLFAAGELMKRLFWTGDIERMRFPAEIEVARLA